MYYDPEKFGLTTIGEIDWSSGSYEFNLTVVWKRNADGTFVYCEDSGCSCPSPFEDEGVDDLREIGSLSEFQEHCATRQEENHDGPREVEIAELVQRMHAAGAR
jgi:hypothetical protein